MTSSAGAAPPLFAPPRVTAVDSGGAVLLRSAEPLGAYPVSVLHSMREHARLAPDHPMVAVTLDKMAEFYAAQERYSEAEPLIVRATAMRAAAAIDSLKRGVRVFVQDLGRSPEKP